VTRSIATESSKAPEKIIFQALFSISLRLLVKAYCFFERKIQIFTLFTIEINVGK